MNYNLRTFRGCQNVSSLKDALDGAYAQLEAIKKDGFDSTYQWVRIEAWKGFCKIVFRGNDGSIGETQWMSRK